MNSPKKTISLFLALLCGISMLSEFVNPTVVNPTGRWSFLFSPIWEKFGSGGLIFYWGSLSVVFSVIYFRSKD